MKHPIRHRLILLAAVLAAFTLSSCATMRPLSSQPPVAKIALLDPYSVRSMLTSIVLPAGEYHPLYEDNRFYYYQAPSKVVVNRLASRMFDGGIYVMRGTIVPRGWYYIDQDGSQTLQQFDTPPPVRVTP